jgi:hypothetical protein
MNLNEIIPLLVMFLLILLKPHPILLLFCLVIAIVSIVSMMEWTETINVRDTKPQWKATRKTWIL